MSSADAIRAVRDQLITFGDDYEAASAAFEWPYFSGQFNWAHDWFDQFARDDQRPGLIIVDENGISATYTFAELVSRSNQLARWLSYRGIGKGDSVIVMLGNQIELWLTMLAIMKLGAVIMPTARAVTAAELPDRISRGNARHAVCNSADVPKFGDLMDEVDVITTDQFVEVADVAADAVDHPQTAADDRLLLYFTSGTTSKPKLVEHNQVSYPVGHLSTMYWIGIGPGDIHLNVSSPGWAKHAWSSFFAPWLAEATIMVYNYERFDATKFLDVLRKHRVTSLCAPPTVWRMMINADLGSKPVELRELVGAGEPLNPEVIQHVRRIWNLTIRDGFGQTETTALVGNTRGCTLKPGSMGRPLPGMPVLLVDPVTGDPSVSEGEICIDLSRRPPSLMVGYVADPDRNASATACGYYHTGDIAALDGEGYLTYIGRTDDVFKSSDYKISPFELESALIEHPAVLEAAVVPSADPVRLAVPKAYVALAPGHPPTAETAREILAFARERLAPYQRIRKVEFFELPKTISGKIRRVELRERESRAERSDHEFYDDQFRRPGG